jgi:hypothetical protein
MSDETIIAIVPEPCRAFMRETVLSKTRFRVRRNGVKWDPGERVGVATRNRFSSTSIVLAPPSAAL